MRLSPAALIGAITWNLLTWYWGFLVPHPHALIGGIIGAVGWSVGFDVLNEAGIIKIFLSLILSPIVAMIGGYIVMKVLLLYFGRFSPIVLNDRFRSMQNCICHHDGLFSHGSNDAQKAMGIITLTLLSGGFIDTLEVPVWVKLCCATAMAMGTAVGGWKNHLYYGD